MTPQKISAARKPAPPAPFINGSFADSKELDFAALFSHGDPLLFIEFPSFMQRLELLDRFMAGHERIMLVIGEHGSGKTTLQNRFLERFEGKRQACHLQIPSSPEAAQMDLLSANFIKHRAVLLPALDPSLLIIDDAHLLPSAELQRLLQDALRPEPDQEWERLILLGEPRLIDLLEQFQDPAAPFSFNRVFLPALSLKQTEVYLKQRLKTAGYEGKPLFSFREIKTLHSDSEGIPGRINENARRLLMGRFPKKRLVPAASISKKISGSISIKQLQERIAGIWIKRGARYTLAGMAAAAVLGCMLVITVAVYSHFKRPNETVFQPPIRITRKVIVPSLPAPKKQPPATLVLPVKPRAKPLAIAPDLPAKAPSKPRVPVSTPALAPKLHREAWLLALPPTRYTIQVVGVRTEAALYRFVKREALSGQLASYQTHYKDGEWYPLLYGIYESRQEALTAMAKLPLRLQKLGPWVRPLSAVQSAIRENATSR